MDPNEIAIPCGMAARAYFNDTFVIKSQTGDNIVIEDKDIAWLDDK